MPSDLTPRERALMALYGRHPPDIKGGLVTEAIESAIVAAVAAERERCAKVADNYATSDRRDAARYRWLRDHQHCIPDLSTCSRELAAKTLDAFLDAEINAEAEPHG
jgi:hypothetical protein